MEKRASLALLGDADKKVEPAEGEISLLFHQKDGRLVNGKK